jgi:dienelactone hydrolase
MYKSGKAIPDAWKERFRTPVITYAGIAFLNPARGFVIANVDETYQLHAWDTEQNTIHQLTRLPGGVDFAAILSDGSGMFYHHDESGQEMGHFYFVSFDGSVTKDLSPGFSDYSRLGISTAFQSKHVTFTTGSIEGFQTYVLEFNHQIDDPLPKLLHRTENISISPRLSHDGRYTVIHSAEKMDGSRFSLIVLDTSSSQMISRLSDGPTCNVECVGFNPSGGDNEILAYTDRSGLIRPTIWNPISGHRVDLELPELEGDLRPLDWMADAAAILLMQMNRGIQKLFTYNLKNGTLLPLETPPGSFGFNRRLFGFEAFSHPDGKIIALHQDAMTPSRIIEIDPVSGHYVDDLLCIKKPPEGHPWKSIEFISTGDTLIQGWLGEPTVGKPPYPAIIHLHGGPALVMTDMFHEGAQAWLDQGFAFLSVNYRGSITFGKAFKECIWGRLGDHELEDIIAAREWLIQERIADPGNIFLTGYSYGGFLTLLALGKAPDLWAGGLAMAAIADWTMSYRDSNPTMRAYCTQLFLGTPEDNPGQWKAASPITYADQFAAPLLIIQGLKDSSTPAEPIRAFDKRLKKLGKKVQVCWYEAGHLGPTTEQWIEFQQLMMDFATQNLS